MRKKKKRNAMDYGTMSAATAPPVNTANMSVSTPQTRLMGMKKGGLCKGMGKATRGGKFGRNG